MHIAILTALLALAVPTAATARTWPDAGGWTIAEGGDFCIMTSEFEGPGDSELYLTINADGLVLMADVNSAWSSQDGAVYKDITAVMGDTEYGGTDAIGVEVNGKKGFLVKLSPTMVDDIAAARSISLYKGEAKMDHLNLSGTGAAIAMTRRCVAALRANRAALEREAAAERAKADREKARYADLAKDPFKP